MTNLIKSLSPQELQSWNVRPDSKVEYYDGKILVVSDPEPEAPFGVAAKAGTALLFGIAVFTHAPLVGVVFGAYAVAKVLGTVSDLYGGDNALMTRLEQDLGLSEPPAAESPAIGTNTRLGAIDVPAVAPGLEANPETPTQSTSEKSVSDQALFNPAIDLGQNPQSALIAGIPGSGKGMVVSNALRVLKQKHSALKVFVIDPKFDPNERGYWDSVADTYRGKAFEDLDDADEGASWILSCLREFQKLPAPKLLIFDESLNVSNVLGLADKEMRAPQKVKLMLSSAITGGDSRGIWVWVLGQSVQVQDLPFNGGVRGNLRVLAIVSEKNLTAIEPLLSTKLIPSPSGGVSELRRLIEASPCNRCFFDGKSSRWLPMPKLENYSGFDRDNRTIEAEPTITNNQPASNQKKPAEAPQQNEPKNPVDRLNKMFSADAYVPPHEEGDEIGIEMAGTILKLADEITKYIKSRPDVTLWNPKSITRANSKFRRHSEHTLTKAFQILALTDEGEWDGENFKPV
ncbi:hypothetical protein ACKFKF_30810 [Phormidesmis sp. 146-12]